MLQVPEREGSPPSMIDDDVSFSEVPSSSKPERGRLRASIDYQSGPIGNMKVTKLNTMPVNTYGHEQKPHDSEAGELRPKGLRKIKSEWREDTGTRDAQAGLMDNPRTFRSLTSVAMRNPRSPRGLSGMAGVSDGSPLLNQYYGNELHFEEDCVQKSKTLKITVQVGSTFTVTLPCLDSRDLGWVQDNTPPIVKIPDPTFTSKSSESGLTDGFYEFKITAVKESKREQNLCFLYREMDLDERRNKDVRPISRAFVEVIIMPAVKKRVEEVKHSIRELKSMQSNVRPQVGRTASQLQKQASYAPLDAYDQLSIRELKRIQSNLRPQVQREASYRTIRC